MQFGARAKTIKNKVQVNKQLSIAELEAALKKLQKDYYSWDYDLYKNKM